MKDSIIAELAIKAQQGDMQAFGQLYTEFSPLIYSILLEITHDAHEAEDLTQDCFISAIKKIHTLKEPAKAKKWLTAIAANLGKDYLKKKKPALLGEEHEYIFDIQEEENPSLMPEENAVLDERSEEIREIVNSVSEDKRLCLVLFYQHEMSIAEISEELGISESAVKSRLFRAREDIKEEIEKRSKKGMPLFGIAPLPLILFALQKSSQVAATSFAGSAAQTAAFAGVTAASQAGIAAVSTAATATTTASAAVSTASTTATTATGIGAKVAAMSVAQKVVAGVAAATVATGSATVTTVVVKNKIEADTVTTTAYVEEVTTAPDYGFENETVFVPPVSETESSTSAISTSGNTSTTRHTSTAKPQETEKSTVKSTTTTKPTTTKPRTTTTTKATTTKKETTTKKVTTTTTIKATTTIKETTTQRATTTKPTSTKATTTTTESVSPATVTVKVYSAGSGSEYKNYTLTFDAGVTLSDSDIETGLMNQHGIDAMADSFSVTTKPGGSYTATAYEI